MLRSETDHTEPTAKMVALENQWKTFSLTHVIYPKGNVSLSCLNYIQLNSQIINFLFSGDHYGKFLGVFSLLPHCLMVAFFTLTLFVRDIHVVIWRNIGPPVEMECSSSFSFNS